MRIKCLFVRVGMYGVLVEIVRVMSFLSSLLLNKYWMDDYSNIFEIIFNPIN